MNCWCYMCQPKDLLFAKLILCPDCGNKRCPKATDHREPCSNSNEPGQLGSRYGVWPNPNRPLIDFLESKQDEI